MSAIRKTVEELSGAIVLAELDDLQCLAAIHKLFGEIGHSDDPEASPSMRHAATASAKLVEQIILSEASDPAASLDILGRCISSLQAAIRNGSAGDEVSFPAELQSEPAGELTPSPQPQEAEAAVVVETPIAPLTAPESVTHNGHQLSEGAEAESTAPSDDEDDECVVAAPTKLPSGEEELSLLGDFINEANEHLEAADQNLLTVETDYTNPDALNAVFRAFHTIKGVAGFLELQDVVAVSHEAESLLDLARTGKIILTGLAMDASFEAVDALKRLIAAWANFLSTSQPPPGDPSLGGLLRRIRQAMTGTTDVSAPKPAKPQANGSTSKSAASVATDVAAAPSPDSQAPSADVAAARPAPRVAASPTGQDDAHPTRAAAPPAPPAAAAGHPSMQLKEVVKVDAVRLDKVVDAIGELVIAVSMVRQSAANGAEPGEAQRQLAHLDKITRELQEMGTSLRMVPVRPVFQKMARMARDLAKKVGKEVEFVMSGEDTELDKTVVDRISDPLVHMIRNAVDHGLEATVEDRVRAGKPEAGRVELSAFHRGGKIYVQISDDGRGLNREAIIAKAKERGLITDADLLSDREIFNLLFLPGFSTAKEVTDVSGRGVGMDVVKRNIESLRGHIELQSEPGQGTTFTIALPLTLAIIDGMVIRVGHERYIIPTLSVVTSLRPTASQISTIMERGEMLKFHRELLPLLRLNRLFEVSDAVRDPSEGLVVIIESDGRRSGLLIDELVGQQQIVIKSLGEAVRGLVGIAGAAIMPDGRIGLILDVGGLVKLANAAGAPEPLAQAQDHFHPELALEGSIA